MQNYSLRQEPRYEPAVVIPLKQETSLLAWLEANGRLIPRDPQEQEGLLDEDEEITELMEGEDREFASEEESFDLEE